MDRPLEEPKLKNKRLVLAEYLGDCFLQLLIGLLRNGYPLGGPTMP